MDILLQLRNLAHPDHAVELAVASLLLAMLAWLIRRDTVAALVLGFSLIVPLFWIEFFASALLSRDPTEPFRAEFPILAMIALSVCALMIGCAFAAGRALLHGRSLQQPERAVSALIVAHALHVHLMFLIIYTSQSKPTWAYWAGRLLQS